MEPTFIALTATFVYSVVQLSKYYGLNGKYLPPLAFVLAMGIFTLEQFAPGFFQNWIAAAGAIAISIPGMHGVVMEGAEKLGSRSSAVAVAPTGDVPVVVDSGQGL